METAASPNTDSSRSLLVCDQCYRCKVKCNKERPCERCSSINRPCTYSLGLWKGRPKGITKKRTSSRMRSSSAASSIGRYPPLEAGLNADTSSTTYSVHRGRSGSLIATSPNLLGPSDTPQPIHTFDSGMWYQQPAEPWNSTSSTTSTALVTIPLDFELPPGPDSEYFWEPPVGTLAEDEEFNDIPGSLSASEAQTAPQSSRQVTPEPVAQNGPSGALDLGINLSSPCDCLHTTASSLDSLSELSTGSALSGRQKIDTGLKVCEQMINCSRCSRRWGAIWCLVNLSEVATQLERLVPLAVQPHNDHSDPGFAHRQVASSDSTSLEYVQRSAVRAVMLLAGLEMMPLYEVTLGNKATMPITSTNDMVNCLRSRLKSLFEPSQSRQ